MQFCSDFMPCARQARMQLGWVAARGAMAVAAAQQAAERRGARRARAGVLALCCARAVLLSHEKNSPLRRSEAANAVGRE